MYDILELTSKLLPELKEIAKSLGVHKVDSFRKKELIYKILDLQAIKASSEQTKPDEFQQKRPRTKTKVLKAYSTAGNKAADAKPEIKKADNQPISVNEVNQKANKDVVSKVEKKPKAQKQKKEAKPTILSDFQNTKEGKKVSEKKRKSRRSCKSATYNN